jgi:hypothetical protein
MVARLSPMLVLEGGALAVKPAERLRPATSCPRSMVGRRIGCVDGP